MWSLLGSFWCISKFSPRTFCQQHPVTHTRACNLQDVRMGLVCSVKYNQTFFLFIYWLIDLFIFEVKRRSFVWGTGKEISTYSRLHIIIIGLIVYTCWFGVIVCYCSSLDIWERFSSSRSTRTAAGATQTVMPSSSACMSTEADGNCSYNDDDH